ncbi:uncharacterized protein F5891DRAFT_991485 [Suillus fuscotomentosus]|uniref:Uncharacterized protein n=1 Tax=Suillus fuscotomentosus TaxID=1912939 RepID=A0AAD4HBY0_9AGAM|nr:uncharacterized protein F5891DRAFT_991485 [Suillus fuscotomentosus]KAG1879953.1 hypothetical protein F5891DRAFT_991485 [Suillus fuscotomentosus]
MPTSQRTSEFAGFDTPAASVPMLAMRAVTSFQTERSTRNHLKKHVVYDNMNKAVPHELELFNPHSISTTSTLCVLTIRNNVTTTLHQNLTFQFNDLGKGVTITLAWMPNLDGLCEDFFPIVWKVSKFRKSGVHTGLPQHTRPSKMIDKINTLESRLYSRAQVESGKVISAATSVNINNSEKTISTEANDVYHFSYIVRLPEL